MINVNANDMLKFLKLAILLLLPFVSAKGQVSWLDEGMLNLGLVSKGEVYPIAFTYRNHSVNPLVIDNIRTSCGCVAPEWSSEPVFQGESGLVHIEWRPMRKGLRREKIKVYFNGLKQVQILTLVAQVQ